MIIIGMLECPCLYGLVVLAVRMSWGLVFSLGGLIDGVSFLLGVWTVFCCSSLVDAIFYLFMFCMHLYRLF